MIDHRDLPEYLQREVDDVLERRRQRALANLVLRVMIVGAPIAAILLVAALIAGQLR